MKISRCIREVFAKKGLHPPIQARFAMYQETCSVRQHHSFSTIIVSVPLVDSIKQVTQLHTDTARLSAHPTSAQITNHKCTYKNHTHQDPQYTSIFLYEGLEVKGVVHIKTWSVRVSTKPTNASMRQQFVLTVRTVHLHDTSHN